MAFLALIPNPVKYAAVGALACLAAFYAGQWHGRSLANAEAEARGAQATIKQLKERGLINDAVSNIPDCDLVLELNPDSVCGDGEP